MKLHEKILVSAFTTIVGVSFIWYSSCIKELYSEVATLRKEMDWAIQDQDSAMELEDKNAQLISMRFKLEREEILAEVDRRIEQGQQDRLEIYPAPAYPQDVYPVPIYPHFSVTNLTTSCFVYVSGKTS